MGTGHKLQKRQPHFTIVKILLQCKINYLNDREPMEAFEIHIETKERVKK